MGSPPLPDLVITLFAVDWFAAFGVSWFTRDPLDAMGVIAWGCFGTWALFYLDCSDMAEPASAGAGARD